MMKKKAKSPKQKIALTAMYALLVLIVYVTVSWQRFTIAHPKAGNGAFYVYFWEVATWGDVEDLK